MLNHPARMLIYPARGQALALEVLDHVLLGTASAPLQVALIASGLGTAVTGGGLETTLQQAVFAIGLKGVADPTAAVGP